MHFPETPRSGLKDPYHDPKENVIGNFRESWLLFVVSKALRKARSFSGSDCAKGDERIISGRSASKIADNSRTQGSRLEERHPAGKTYDLTQEPEAHFGTKVACGFP